MHEVSSTIRETHETQPNETAEPFQYRLLFAAIGMAWQAHTHGNAWSEDEKTRQVLLTELSLSADSAQCDCIEECGPLCKSPGKMMMIFLFFLLFFAIISIRIMMVIVGICRHQ